MGKKNISHVICDKEEQGRLTTSNNKKQVQKEVNLLESKPGIQKMAPCSVLS